LADPPEPIRMKTTYPAQHRLSTAETLDLRGALFSMQTILIQWIWRGRQGGSTRQAAL